MTIKESFRSTFLHLKTLFQDWISQTVQNDQLSMIHFILYSSFCSIISNIGINFENQILIYIALILGPFSIAFIHFTIACYQLDLNLLKSALNRILIGTFIIVLISWIYYHITPFAYNIAFVRELAQVDVATYLAVFILGLGFGLYTKFNIQAVIWLLSILIHWISLVAVATICLSMSDWTMMSHIVLSFTLLFACLFCGFYLKMMGMKISKQENTSKYIWIIKLITSVLFIFFVYCGGNEILKLTTHHNTKQYLKNEFESKSFTISNFLIQKSSKEVFVYYSGTIPSSTQDDQIKKKYNLSGYHFVYQEIK